jgi:hypothetical protein
MEFISVPKDMGSGDLRSDIVGLAKAELVKLHWGTSRANRPKVTIEFVILEDVPGIEPPTTGEKVLESASLQPQALWKLNAYYKSATDEDIPEGDYSFVEFQEIIEKALLGTKWDLDLFTGQDDKQQPRTQVRKANAV